MHNRIGQIEKKLIDNKKKGKKSLIAYINAGDPDLEITKGIIEMLESYNLDIVELGVPFPNSFTDGKVILRSHERALKSKITLEDILEMVHTQRKTCKIPIVLLSEFSHSVRPYGLKNFLSQCRDAQIDGILLHCLPPYLTQEYCFWASTYELEPIFSFYPNTKGEKRKAIYDIARGFIYLVSNYGKTGKKNAFSDKTIAYLKKVRQETTIPLAVGFGVKSPKELRIAYKAGMDAAIIGSSLVSIIERNIHETPRIYSKLGSSLQEFINEKNKFSCEV